VVQEPAPPAPQPPPAAPLDAEAGTRLAEEILGKGRALLAEGKFWDAIQTLEGGLHLAPGTRTNRTLRILLAQATAKNPQWHESAEEMLVALTHESPAPLEAFMALSVLYEEKGLKARAAAQLRRVLELHPGHADALARLKALD
jgi:tetratricopeptide (TPR) repeat protein